VSPDGATPLLELEGVRAGYGNVAVVRGVDLRVEPGEVVALIGPNGAGKTTTLITAAGLIAHLDGKLRVLGASQPARGHRGAKGRAPRLVRAGLALVPENRALWYGLTARQHLRLASPDKGHGYEDVLEAFPALVKILDRRAGLMSGGEQQMLALARALAMHPKLLLVDELSLGLAPIIVEQLLSLVQGIAHDRGIGVLLVEQHVPAVLSVADRAYVMVRGSIVAGGSATDLAADPDRLREAYLGAGPPSS